MYELDKIKGYGRVKLAMALAIATHQNILVFGKDPMKSTLMKCMPELLPPLTTEESQSVTRIWSMAGLAGNEMITKRPFRVPHYSATIEGMCGGGHNLRPGEISLAHNGVLFLDDAVEFKTCILQMLRVPLESRAIHISKAGRSIVFPANFILAMTCDSCPCGNCGVKDKICLCSGKSVEQYWKKFSAPFMRRMGIRVNIDLEDNTDYSVESLKNKIAFFADNPKGQETIKNAICDKTPYDEFCGECK